MLIPLSECSNLTGTSRSGLLKAIKRGTLSASRDPSTNQWLVDVAELSRVYKVVPIQNKDEEHQGEVRGQSNEQSEVLRTEVRHLKELLDVITNERNDLRTRLDRESEERRKLTAMLTSPMPASEPVVARHRTSALIYILVTIIVLISSVAVYKLTGH